MTWFLIGLVLLFGLLGGLSWLSRAQPKDVVRNLKWVALAVVVIVLIGLAATRNFHFLWGLGLAALPWINRGWFAWNLWRRMKGPSQGRKSGIVTDFLDMTLDHDTGEMDGRILKGPYQGALLSELDQTELVALLLEMEQAGDDRSRSLLEAYMDRMFGAEWRSGTKHESRDGEHREERSGRSSARRSKMPRDEALKLLGLKEGASVEEIEAAYKRLMKQVHPDAGGSDYLASQVNAAKDALLKP